MESLDPQKFDDYNEWLSLASVIINEGLDIKIFDNVSKKSQNYNATTNQTKYEQIQKNINRNVKATISGLIQKLKEDNSIIYTKLFTASEFLDINDDLIINDNYIIKDINSKYVFDNTEKIKNTFSYDDFYNNDI